MGNNWILNKILLCYLSWTFNHVWATLFFPHLSSNIIILSAVLYTGFQTTVYEVIALERAMLGIKKKVWNLVSSHLITKVAFLYSALIPREWPRQILTIIRSCWWSTADKRSQCMDMKWSCLRYLCATYLMRHGLISHQYLLCFL